MYIWILKNVYPLQKDQERILKLIVIVLTEYLWS